MICPKCGGKLVILGKKSEKESDGIDKRRRACIKCRRMYLTSEELIEFIGYTKDKRIKKN